MYCTYLLIMMIDLVLLVILKNIAETKIYFGKCFGDMTAKNLEAVEAISICLKEHILNFLKTGKTVMLKSDIEIAFLFY